MTKILLFIGYCIIRAPSPRLHRVAYQVLGLSIIYYLTTYCIANWTVAADALHKYCAMQYCCIAHAQHSPISDKEGVGVGFCYVGRGMIITNYDVVIE